MHKIRFPLGLRPRLRWGSLHAATASGEAYSAPPDAVAVYKGPTSKGSAGRETGGEGREGEAQEGPGPPNILA